MSRFFTHSHTHIKAVPSRTFLISTEVVDPDYLINFVPRTISVPEFEELVRQHNNEVVYTDFFCSRHFVVVVVFQSVSLLTLCFCLFFSHFYLAFLS